MGLAALSLLLTLCLSSVLSDPAPSPERGVDCRKFVFAPLCRGVAAKRTTMKAAMRNGIVVDAKKLREFLKSYNMAGDILDENVAAEEPASALRNSRRHESDTLPFYDYDHNK